jgi:D-mannonate dehydratase
MAFDISLLNFSSQAALHPLSQSTSIEARNSNTSASTRRDEIWANYTYFVKAVLPVAEEAGVKLAFGLEIGSA